VDESAITPELRALVGVEGKPSSVEIDRSGIRMWARSTGETNRIYYDIEAARAAGYPDLPAPPGFLGRYVYLPGESDPTSSGPSDNADLPLGDFGNDLHGSLGIRTYRRLFAGERLTASNRIVDVSERDGRLGRMIRVDTVLTYRDEQGEVVAEKFDTVLYYR